MLPKATGPGGGLRPRLLDEFHGGGGRPHLRHRRLTRNVGHRPGKKFAGATGRVLFGRRLSARKSIRRLQRGAGQFLVFAYSESANFGVPGRLPSTSRSGRSRVYGG